MDMEKVIMLPRVSGLKIAVFTKRLIVFPETFAPLGLKVVKNFAGTYPKIFHHPKIRDYKNIVLWADNCIGQKENWFFYTMFCYEVNKQDGSDVITVKYFKKRYIFMSADSFHHQTEKWIKQMKHVYDFLNFESVMSSQSGLSVNCK